jgi:hypothetical protein
MNYLYGDSTASQLKSNFLEFLRDAIDFCVFVLQADAKIKAGHVEIARLGEEADKESARLERFVNGVSKAVHEGEKGEPNSPTAECGARLAGLIIDAHRAAADGIRSSLALAKAKIDQEESAGRDECLEALGTLLAPHDPPNAVSVMRVTLGDGGRYKVTTEGKAEPALEWTLTLGVPDGHAWASPVRVERVLPTLEIRAPQLAGWITKEVKTRPQKLERHLVTKLVDDGSTVAMELRGEGTPDVGFDFDVDVAESTVKAKRVGPADDQSVGKFELHADDVGLIVDLAEKLRATLTGLER